MSDFLKLTEFPNFDVVENSDLANESDSEVFDRSKSYPGDEQRGNEYVKMAKEMISRDSAKLKRSKFSKVH